MILTAATTAHLRQLFHWEFYFFSNRMQTLWLIRGGEGSGGWGSFRESEEFCIISDSALSCVFYFSFFFQVAFFPAELFKYTIFYNNFINKNSIK